MKLRVGPSWAEVIDYTPDEGNWLRKLMTVRAGTDWYTKDLRVCFLSMLRGVFPAGLLSYVAAEAARAKRPLDVEWAPGASVLPVSCPEVYADGYTFPNGKQLYEHQRKTVAAGGPAGRAVVESATGSGKTPMMAALLMTLGLPKTLILVGRRNLVKQTAAEVGDWIGEEVGEASSARRVLGPRVVVALVDSLAAHRDEPWAVELLSRPLLLLDECHHVNRSTGRGAGGGRWYELAQASAAANRYGFSATALKPGDTVQNWRLVGATGPRLDAGVSASALIESEYGARPYIYYMQFPAPRLPKSLGYEEAVDRGLVNCIERNEAVVRATRALLALNIKVLVLVEKLAHGKLLEMMLQGAGAPVVMTSGVMGQLEQERAIAWLREPGPRCVVATRVISEGVNVPDLGGLVYARGGKSYVMLMQAVGRPMRPKGEAGEVGGGGSCVVVDFEDTHNPYLKRHYEERRVMLSRESAFRVASPGQTIEEFSRAVLAGAAKIAEAEVDADEGGDAADAPGPVGQVGA